MTAEFHDVRNDIAEHAPAGSRAELLVVFGITLGISAILTIRQGPFGQFDFGQSRLLTTIAWEVGVSALLWPWLSRRGWALGRIAGAPGAWDLPRGIGLAVVAYAGVFASFVAWYVTALATLQSATAIPMVGHASPAVVAAMCIINPVFEEFLWLAYGLTAFSPFGLRVAMLASIALRTAVHAYQGLLAVITILPVAVIFTVYYVRTRRLWPVIVAHMIVDTLALMRVVHG